MNYYKINSIYITKIKIQYTIILINKIKINKYVVLFIFIVAKLTDTRDVDRWFLYPLLHLHVSIHFRSDNFFDFVHHSISLYHLL